MSAGQPQDIQVDRSESLVRAELIIAYVLRYGILLCGAVMAVGMALQLSRPGTAELFFAMRNGDGAALGQATPRTAAAFAAGLAQLDPNTIISLGLVMLIALPIVRVAMTVVIFILEKDRIYLCITLFVLAILTTGVMLGKIAA